ncbi:PREDICTED: transmembrane protein 121-like [Cyprinodon variegatus]|uniref:transmembrane protein 121-like n=1 Tax=Cyprinodon variegatus TaxID=28743 RepID=UPI000742C1CA|nr:PREDICTED: transmembrane protein 121-like [Cyprinodon variegatus]
MADPSSSKNKPYSWLVMAIIITSLLLLDLLLVQQSPAPKMTGVCISVVVGDVSFFVILRYLAIWVGTEVHSAKRGYAMILWFFYIFVLELKVYFVYQSFRSQDLDAELGSDGSRRSLTLLLCISLPLMFVTLAAVDQLDFLQQYNKREEMRSRLFWVVLDLLDVVDVQADLWELQRERLPLWMEGVMFFYSYMILLVLPCVSLGEISMQGVHIAPHRMMLYHVVSLISINVITLLIRGGNLLLYSHMSGIMVGKNGITILLKSFSLVEFRKHQLAPPTIDQGSELRQDVIGEVQGTSRRQMVVPRVVIEDFTTIPEEDEEEGGTKQGEDNQRNPAVDQQPEASTDVLIPLNLSLLRVD